MKYKVIIEPEAQAQIIKSYQFIQADSPRKAELWFAGVYERIDTLESMPQRCPYARENGSALYELRQLLFESHRIIFTVYQGEVHVLSVWHAARDNLEFD